MKKPRSFACLRASLLALVFAAGLGSAEAKQLALIVGVSNYPAASVGDLQLAGPKHDAALMIDTMSRAGFKSEDMIVLADGLEETDTKRKADGLPTKAAIMAGLKRLADTAQSGDTVLIYLSGHGSQQPDLHPEKRPVPKPDGLDEIFLPIDIGTWQDAVQTVENALPDYELGQAVNAVRAKGALVWVVIDACHSGTMTRSVSPGTMIKQVPPARLGIPQAAFDKRAMTPKHDAARSWVFGETKTAATRSLGGLEGGYVAFFAAYPDQAAQQENLPKSFGPNPDKRPHGVLTFYLAQALRSGHAANFKDLAHQVLSGYSQFGAEAPVPMFEGDLTSVVPGTEGKGVARFAAKRDKDQISIEAGALDGLEAGTILGFGSGDDPATFKGFGRVETVSAAKAKAVLIAHEAITADAPDLPQDALVASVVARGADLSLRVALPQQQSAKAQAVTAALQQIMTSPTQGFKLESVAADQQADFYLRVEDDRLWLIPENGSFEKQGRAHTRYLDLPTDAAEPLRKSLEPALTGLAKVKNLLRVANAIQGDTLGGKLNIEQYVWRDSSATSGSMAPDAKACAPAAREVPPDAVKIERADITTPDFGQCDLIYFKLSNGGDKPIDITPLYLDGGGAISYFGPETGLRLEPKAKPSLVALRIKTWNMESQKPEPVGQERFLFIAVEVEGRQAFAANFAYLAQPTQTRSAMSSTPLGAFLDAAAFGAKTRAVSAPDAGNAAILTYRWNVVAPAGAK